MDKDTAMEMNLDCRQVELRWLAIKSTLRKMEYNIPPALMEELWYRADGMKSQVDLYKQTERELGMKPRPEIWEDHTRWCQLIMSDLGKLHDEYREPKYGVFAHDKLTAAFEICDDFINGAESFFLLCENLKLEKEAQKLLKERQKLLKRNDLDKAWQMIDRSLERLADVLDKSVAYLKKRRDAILKLSPREAEKLRRQEPTMDGPGDKKMKKVVARRSPARGKEQGR